MRLRVAPRIVSEGARDRFWRSHSKVVQIVGMSSVWKVGIDNAMGKIRTIAREAIKVILVRGVVEFRDQLAVLLFSGVDDEDVEAANQRGGDHFTPFGLVTIPAGIARAQRGQVVVTVSFFQKVLNFIRSKDRPIAGILDSIKVDIQRNHVPFVGLILPNVYVVAHHRAVFIGTAQAKLYRRFGTDAREIYGSVARLANSVDALVQGFVKHDSYVRVCAGSEQANEKEGQRTRNPRLAEKRDDCGFSRHWTSSSLGTLPQ